MNKLKIGVLASAAAIAGFSAGYFAAPLPQVLPVKVASTGGAVSVSVPTRGRPDAGAVAGEYERATVKRAIDGDTIELAGGERVRYIGIEAPELVHPRKPIECFAREAAERNRELVQGKEVRLARDVSDRDRYGRLLRYVWVAADSASSPRDKTVNLELVEEGYASAETFPPDVKYRDEFTAAERRAREARRGLWSACGNP